MEAPRSHFFATLDVIFRITRPLEKEKPFIRCGVIDAYAPMTKAARYAEPNKHANSPLSAPAPRSPLSFYHPAVICDKWHIRMRQIQTKLAQSNRVSPLKRKNRA